MRQIAVFTKKELLESWRTHKLLILAIIFLIFGIMNPLMAKFTPEILKTAFGDSLNMELPKPTSLDSWTQFYKNMTQMGLIVIALIFSGTVSHEVSQGTLVNLVTKGLRRSVIIISKLLSLWLQWTVCVLLTFEVTWGYTLYYFPDDKSPYIFSAVLPLWLFGLLLIAVIVWGSALARNSYEGLLLTGGFVVVLIGLNLFKQVKEYNPINLINENMTFLQNADKLGDYLPALLITIVLTFFFSGLGIVILDRKKL